jgi:hypothetical protein
MSGTQIPTADHEPSFGGVAPWPLPGVVSMTEIRRDPAARGGKECGRRLLPQSWAAHGPVSRHDLAMAG